MVSRRNFWTRFNYERHSLSLLVRGLLQLSFPWWFPFRSGTARPRPDESLDTAGLLHLVAELLLLFRWHFFLFHVTAIVVTVSKAVALDLPPVAHDVLVIPDWPILLDFSTENLPFLLWLHLEGVKLMVI